jgi:hypothetical protein
VISHFLYYANEADWIRRVGVVVALAGTAAAAPEGTVRLWRTVVAWVRRGLNNVRAALMRFLPFLRQHASVAPSTVHAYAQVAGAAGLAASGRGWIKQGSLEAQVEYLEKQIQRAFDEIEKVRLEAKEDHAALMRVFEERVSELRADLQNLRDSFRVRRDWEAAVDARGIFVIALGIFLWGIPVELATVPLVGWLFSIIALILTVMFVRRVFADLP